MNNMWININPTSDFPENQRKNKFCVSGLRRVKTPDKFFKYEDRVIFGHANSHMEAINNIAESVWLK